MLTIELGEESVVTVECVIKLANSTLFFRSVVTALTPDKDQKSFGVEIETLAEPMADLTVVTMVRNWLAVIGDAHSISIPSKPRLKNGVNLDSKVAK